MVMVLQSQLLSVSHVWKYKNNQKHMGYWYWLTVNPNIKRVKRCRKIARRIDTEPAAFFSVLSHAKTRRISDLLWCCLKKKIDGDLGTTINRWVKSWCFQISREPLGLRHQDAQPCNGKHQGCDDVQLTNTNIAKWSLDLLVKWN